MKKVQWIVMKDGVEVVRQSTRRMAEVIAMEIGGMVVKYTKE